MSAISALAAIREQRNGSTPVTEEEYDSDYDTYSGYDGDENTKTDLDPITYESITFKPSGNNVIEQGKSMYIGLNKSERLAIKGMARVKVGRGVISIFGSVFTPDSDKFDLYAPESGSSLPLIKAKGNNTDINELDDIPSQLSEFPVVVHLESFEQPTLRLLSRLVQPVQRLWDVSSQSSFELVTTTSLPLRTVFNSWKSKSLQPGSKYMIIGSKSSGKSTLAQYLINKYLNTNPFVYYLDLDPGQPEYSPSGIISLIKVTSPTFGPPFTKSNHFNPLLAFALGYTSPKDQPSLYLKQASDLIKAYHDLNSSAPLVVNTPGWTRGLGIELITEISRYLDPTSIIHVGALANTQYEIPGCFDPQIPFTCVQSVLSDPVTTGKGDLTAALARTLSFMSYFHRTSDMLAHLTRIPPYEVPFESIAGVAVLGSDGVNGADVATMLNGVIIAMILLPEQHDQLPITDVDGIKWITNDRAAYGQFLGYAVIQAISPTGFRVLTPDPPMVDHPENRLVFVRGRMSLPVWEMWDPNGIKSGPYLSKDKPGTAHVRRNIRRR